MTYTPMTDEEKAELTEPEIQARMAELEAALADLRIPAPQPYPKWVEIGGINRVVESEDEEERLLSAEADAKKADAKANRRAPHAE